MDEPIQDKPQDLSMKSCRKVKPIPPPLDLNARTLEDEAATDLRLPKSPGDLPRECLPIRKRPLVEIRRELHSKSPKSVGSFSPFEGHPQLYQHHNFSIESFRLSSTGGNHTAPCSPLSSGPSRLSFHHSSTQPSTLVLTPSSATSSSAFTHFPVPPPLIPAALAAVYAPKSPYLSAGANGFPTPPTELHSPFQWASPSALASVLNTPFSPGVPLSPLPFSTSSLLSPAPSSYPSSTNSSREDLPHNGPAGVSDKESKRRLLSAHNNSSLTGGPDSSSPVPSSPLLSPRTWSHNWPTPAWQCFVSGTLIRFLLPNTDTPWQKAEELGWKDHIALKVDSRNPYQYAPHGLTIVKIDVISRESHDSFSESFSHKDSAAILRLRLAPHRMDNTPEILAECSLDHPFFIKEKGWSSAHPRMSIDKYGIPCQELSVGDICLPPNHPEAVRTPDLCDRFRRFEFSTDDPLSPLARPMPRLVSVSSKMSPPSSPAKKKEKDTGDKPKRPMNGFMLFAKKYRLELIQQHPGKDNRAISVLLGEAWKSLPIDEREQYSQRAKLLADEQKKMFPDCWKRKRTLTTNGGHATSPSAASGGPSSSTPPSMLAIRQDLMAARENSPQN